MVWLLQCQPSEIASEHTKPKRFTIFHWPSSRKILSLYRVYPDSSLVWKKSTKGSFNTQKFSITLRQDEILPVSPFNNLLPQMKISLLSSTNPIQSPGTNMIFSLDPLLSQNNSIHSGAEQKNIGFCVGVGFLQLSFLLGENSSCNISFILHIRLRAYLQNTVYFI